MASEIGFMLPPKIESKHVVSGYLQHANGIRFNHQRVQLIVPQNFWRKKNILSECTTDEHGNFAFKFKAKKFPQDERVNVYLNILEESLPSEGKKWRVMDRIPLEVNLSIKRNETGAVTGKLFERQKDLPLLQDVDPDEENDNYANFPIASIVGIVRGALLEVGKKLVLKVGSHFISIEHVQGLYEGDYKKRPLSKEFVADMILNWEGKARFKTGSSKDEFIYELNWDEYERDDDAEIFYPNTKTIFKNSDGKYEIIRIEVELEPGIFTSYQQGHPHFEPYLYIVASEAFYYVEAAEHLGFAHLITEQLALASQAPINLSPLKSIFDWIFDGVYQINKFGSKVIFDKEEGVLGVGPFSDKGTRDTLSIRYRNFCYTHFHPDPVTTKDDLLGLFKNTAWDKVIVPFVDGFFEENEKEIRKYWNEIESLSYNLVDNSMSFKAIKGNSNSCEIDNVITDRIRHEGELKAMRPIKDMDGLKQFMRTAIFTSVFLHSWLHYKQEDYARNLRLASLAPRGKEPNWHQNMGNTSVHDGSKILEIASILVNAKMPTLLENIYRQVPQKFLDLVISQKEAFAKTGLPIEKLLPGVTI